MLSPSLSALVPAFANSSIPRLSIDLHPGTLAFIIFCAALVVGVLASLVVLGLYTERRKRSAAHHDTWIGSTSREEADAEPFVPDDERRVSKTVEELFGTGGGGNAQTTPAEDEAD